MVKAGRQLLDRMYFSQCRYLTAPRLRAARRGFVAGEGSVVHAFLWGNWGAGPSYLTMSQRSQDGARRLLRGGETRAITRRLGRFCRLRHGRLCSSKRFSVSPCRGVRVLTTETWLNQISDCAQQCTSVERAIRRLALCSCLPVSVSSVHVAMPLVIKRHDFRSVIEVHRHAKSIICSLKSEGCCQL